MDLELEDKVAMITEGTRGIGLAVARLLATGDAEVVAVSRNADEAVRAADDVARAAGRRGLGLAARTTDDGAVAATVERDMCGAHILVKYAAARCTEGGTRAVRSELYLQDVAHGHQGHRLAERDAGCRGEAGTVGGGGDDLVTATGTERVAEFALLAAEAAGCLVALEASAYIGSCP